MTLHVVLDILGVDRRLNPKLLLFKLVGDGSGQIHYGMVYSGFYKFRGHVVRYVSLYTCDSAFY